MDCVSGVLPGVFVFSPWRELHEAIVVFETPGFWPGPHPQGRATVMSLTPQIDTIEISDADLDNISGGADPGDSDHVVIVDGQEVGARFLKPALAPTNPTRPGGP
jgi:hypothetical protein